MAKYNHFSKQKYKAILFSSLATGDEFRNDFHSKGRRRMDILCVKTGLLRYIEKRSKKEHTLINADGYMVRSALERILDENNVA